MRDKVASDICFSAMNTDIFAALASWFATNQDEDSPSNSNKPEFDAPDCAALEDRVLYSAVPLNVDIEDPEDLDADADMDPDEYTIVAEVNPLQQRAMEEMQTQDGDLLDTFGDPALDDELELFFIDSGVEDIDALVDDLLEQAEGGRNLEIVLLDAAADGIEQISKTLALYDDLEAVHVISHGEGDSVRLGASRLESGTLGGYAADIAAWSDALGSDSDLLFYGCNLASTEDGRTLLDSLSVLCDCDVAASDDITGHAEMGGDWELEYVVGAIESDPAFTYALQVSWQSTLDITSNLVAHYEFEENGGSTALDSTANNNDGGWSNGPSWTTDSAIGTYAMNFDGDAVNANAVVSVPDDSSLDFDGDFSVAFWYNASTIQSNMTRLVGSHDGSEGFSIYANADGSVNFFVAAEDGSTTASLSSGLVADGNWHLIVATRSGNATNLYLDDSSSASANGSLGELDVAAPLTIGGQSATVSDYEGALDDVRVYTRQLTASDVGELYALHAGGGSYGASNGANNSFEHITNVTFAGINNTTGVDAGGYADYTAQSATVVQGSTNTLSVEISPDSQDYITAWVDWNQDFDFNDAGEEFVVATNVNTNGPHTVDIVAPNDAVVGDTRMRVSLVYQNTPQPTGAFLYGEVEDYTVTVQAIPGLLGRTSDVHGRWRLGHQPGRWQRCLPAGC